MKKNTASNKQNKITPHIQMVLVVFTLAAVSFAAGYYTAAAQIAAMIIK